MASQLAACSLKEKVAHMEPLAVAWIINTVLLVALTLSLAGLHIHNARMNADMKKLEQELGHVLVQLQAYAEGDGVVAPVRDFDAKGFVELEGTHEHH